MLPEAIIRLVMFKQQLPYSKAKQAYQTDILKVRSIQKWIDKSLIYFMLTYYGF